MGAAASDDDAGFEHYDDDQSSSSSEASGLEAAADRPGEPPEGGEARSCSRRPEADGARGRGDGRSMWAH
eukprot:8501410-Lingulodinium_polyedra.AAC.1